MENHIGIVEFDFYKQNNLIALFEEGSVREIDLKECKFNKLPNLETDGSFFSLKKIDEHSFAVLGDHSLIIHNNITNKSQIETFEEKASCMIVLNSKLSVLVGFCNGWLRTYQIN